MQCCYVPQDTEVQCPKDAEFEIWTQNAHPSITTLACIEHVGMLLEDGTSSVWPVEEPSN